MGYMECSINAKITLLRAGFEQYPTYLPAAQLSLGEGLFCVCDELETQLKNSDSPSKNYCLGYLVSIKEAANDIAKRPLTELELKMVSTVHC